jgi:hypothetical protein
MEKVAGLLESMKLSESERKSITIGGLVDDGGGKREPQAVGRVFSDRPARKEAFELALGRVWCPLKGIDCKDLGDNRFLITFLQASGKRRALDDGPWNFGGKELVVVEDFDGEKTIDEIEFKSIPMWVRIHNMPLGFMHRVAGKAIGDMIGEVMEVEVDENDSAIGQFLRVKIRWDIRKPLLRGVTVDIGKEGRKKEIWCPLVYEFLPEFCYSCGIIGHTDRSCEAKKGKGEHLFSAKLRWMPDKRRVVDDTASWGTGSRSSLPWRGGGVGSRSSGGRGSGSSGGGRGSDAPSWRKDKSVMAVEETREEEEVTSPLKKKPWKVQAGDGSGNVKKTLH